MKTTKSGKASKLEEKIEKAHDLQRGQAWQWEACGVKGTDRCAICGLTHHWYRGGQNTGSADEWQDATGQELTLGQASRAVCE